jgi:hypothetical protein
MLRSTLSLLLMLCLGTAALAQEEKDTLVTGRFEKVRLTQLLRQVEAQTPYHFYYDSTQIDSIEVTLSVTAQPLSKVLEAVLKGTDIRFSIDRDKRVYLSRTFQIVTTLPAGFAEKEGTPAGQPPANTIASMEEKKKVTTTSGENRLYEIGTRGGPARQGEAVLTGYIRNAKTGEPLINGVIFVDKLQRSVVTDQYGFYSLSLPLGTHSLQVQGIGMKDANYQVAIHSNGRLDIELKEQVTTLREVVVSARKVANVRSVQMGVERLSIATIKQVPTVLGEADVIKVVLTLPGVKTVGEASSGFNVRGGSTDQNLILFNDATIYNPSHFFGMFSAFNAEVIKDVELYKSSIPARYGGRLSSVLDITAREGNKKEFTGSAGIGLVTSRFNLEGPIAKDKTSFTLGGRATYANWLLDLLPHQYDNSKASFYDVNLNVSHRINQKNDLYFTGYRSDDRFSLDSDTTYNYNNQNVSVKWKHVFGSKLNGFFTAGYDQYKYKVYSDANKVNAYEMFFDINQLNTKADFTYLVNARHNIEFGASSIRYKLHPGSFKPRGSGSMVTPDIVAAEQALESAVYLSDRFNVSNQFSIDAGLRYSLYSFLGPGEVAVYAKGLPRTEANRIEVKDYGKGRFIKNYGGPEYRLSLRYAFTPSFSVKAGYNSLRQYIHMLSNTTSIAPTDIWKLSDPNIRPQQGDQVSLGLYKNLKNNSIETSVEVYYKRLKDYLDYKPGAQLVLNHHVETEVVNTKGKAYGVEVMIKRPGGKLNGWIAYTYSRVLLKMDDPTTGLVVNGGDYYPANYDKPHDATMVGNFKVNHRFSLSANVTYSTGRPITLPVGRYYYMGSQRVVYSERNAYRIPDYFRADFAMNILGNHKVHQKTHNSWTLGVYNLTGRRNAYSVYYVSENGQVNGYKLSIFGSMIPFINYNIHF